MSFVSITRETIIRRGDIVGPKYLMAVSNGDLMRHTFSWEKIHKHVKTPSKKNYARAGWVCYSDRNVSICSGESRVISLGFKITKYPEGVYGRFSSRTTLAIHHGIEVGNLILEPDYFDEVRVVMHNYHSFETFEIKKGDPICVLTFEPFYNLATFGATSKMPRHPEDIKSEIHCITCGSSSSDEDHSDGNSEKSYVRKKMMF